MMLTMDVLIMNKYKIGNLLGEGSFGKIFEGINILTEERVAIKIEKKSNKSILMHEANIYNRCKEIKNIPKIKNFCVENDYNCMIIERLGKTIEELKTICGGRFKLRTVLMMCIQLINCIENLHNIGIVHRDLKPENLLMGLDKNRKMFYLIDFGLAVHYIDESGKHKPIITGKSLTGTIRYASLNVQDGIEASRRDDLESLGYIFIYCLKGNLPWQSVKCNNKDETHSVISACKREMNLFSLCSELPFEFLIYLDYCRKLKYDESPDYNYLKCLFMNLFKLKKFNISSDFEWSNSGIDDV